MTHPEAIDTARSASLRFGKQFVVFRLPAWPPEVFSCQAHGKLEKGLPSEAQTFEVLDPKDALGTKQASKSQGSLFE